MIIRESEDEAFENYRVETPEYGEVRRAPGYFVWRLLQRTQNLGAGLPGSEACHGFVDTTSLGEDVPAMPRSLGIKPHLESRCGLRSARLGQVVGALHSDPVTGVAPAEALQSERKTR